MNRLAIAADGGCPFCRSVFHMEPQIGEKVLFLSGINTGTCGMIVPPMRTLRPDEFCIEKADQPNSMCTCHAGRDRQLPVEQYRVPDWMPPLSMEDSFNFHESLSACIALPAEGATREMISEAVVGAISCCWSRRLPMSSADVWKILGAHGVSDDYRDQLCFIFDFGLRLTIQLNGRPSSHARKMPPMSRIQYMTKGKEALWESVKRHDNIPDILPAALNHN